MAPQEAGNRWFALLLFQMQSLMLDGISGLPARFSTLSLGPMFGFRARAVCTVTPWGVVVIGASVLASGLLAGVSLLC